MITPCLWTDFLAEYEPEDAIRVIGAAGFRQTEFGCTHEKAYLEGKEDEGQRLTSIRRAAEHAGVEIVQMHGRLCNFLAPDADENIAWAHRSLRRAAALGVRWVVLHPGNVDNYGTDPEAVDYTRSRNVELFRSFVKTAEDVGVGIAIENMSLKSPRFGASVGDLLWLIDQLNSDRVGVCWDTGHANLSKLNQARALAAIGKRLVALHIDDNDGRSDQHLTPMRGQIDWVAVVRALRQINYNGPFNLEVPGECRVTPSAAKPAKASYLAAVCQVMLAPEFASIESIEEKRVG